MKVQRTRLLNIGCGHTLHPDWTNLDVAPAASGVLRWDVKGGLPFPDESFDAVYCSHVLEHLEPENAPLLADHMFRILRPGGIVRVVVPDLEGIAREYLKALDDVEAGDADREADYDWMVLELYDQAVRNVPGGRMGAMLSRSDLGNRPFILSRVGAEAQAFWDRQADGSPMRKLARRRPLDVLRLARNRLRPFEHLAGVLVRLVAGRSGHLAYRQGLFRRSGEIHQWMYDRFSLSRLLRSAGFEEIRKLSAEASAIPLFSGYGLDLDPGGSARKPDSLFMEGVRRR